MLLVLAASTQIAEAQTNTVRQDHRFSAQQRVNSSNSPAAQAIPTVSVPQPQPIDVPTLSIPAPLPTATARVKSKRQLGRHTANPRQWILAYLTSYCPGSAGWVSASGMPVFYGMLANDFYRFGTRVYLPILGMTGIVEDRLGAFSMWNHFDVWSQTCYGTPTGWFKVSIQVN